jgi:hypothetical protein
MTMDHGPTDNEVDWQEANSVVNLCGVAKHIGKYQERKIFTTNGLWLVALYVAGCPVDCGHDPDHCRNFNQAGQTP